MVGSNVNRSVHSMYVSYHTESTVDIQMSGPSIADTMCNTITTSWVLVTSNLQRQHTIPLTQTAPLLLIIHLLIDRQCACDVGIPMGTVIEEHC